MLVFGINTNQNYIWLEYADALRNIWIIFHSNFNKKFNCIDIVADKTTEIIYILRSLKQHRKFIEF